MRRGTGRLIDITLTTDQERYDSCPSIQANRRNPSLRERPFTEFAGAPLKIFSNPVTHTAGDGFAFLCELPHFEVWTPDAQKYGHRTVAWVCAHMAEIPD